MTVEDFKVGQKVTYIPRHAREDIMHKDREVGTVTSINDRFVFMNSQACSPDDLRIGDQTFYCADEHNSVLDGAFGRCQSICNYCQNILEILEAKGTKP